MPYPLCIFIRKNRYELAQDFMVPLSKWHFVGRGSSNPSVRKMFIEVNLHTGRPMGCCTINWKMKLLMLSCNCDINQNVNISKKVAPVAVYSWKKKGPHTFFKDTVQSIFTLGEYWMSCTVNFWDSLFPKSKHFSCEPSHWCEILLDLS